MIRARIAVTVWSTLLAGLLVTTNAGAQPSHGRAWTGHVTGHPPGVAQPIVPHGFFGFPNFPNAPAPRPVPPNGVVTRPFPRSHVRRHHFVPYVVPGSVVVYAPSYVSSPGAYAIDPEWSYGPADYGPTVSGPTPQVASPSAATPAAPPVQNVVQYATGRYELRGDGIAVPYTWVWIPNPPPAPPSGGPGDRSALPFSSPSRHDTLFRWTDGEGVLHITDRWEQVPPEFRGRAKSPAPS